MTAATDAGREGELIFRFVYQMAGCTKPVKRLWISSMEEAAIREGCANLRPDSDYDACLLYTSVVGLTMNILSICIFLVTYGRMIEIYVVTALGPIPLATMGNSEWRSTGQNYLKSLLALGFQAFLIMIVVGIYAVLIRNISGAADIAGAIWGCMGYTVLLCFCLFKTGSISKSVFGAH